MNQDKTSKQAAINILFILNNNKSGFVRSSNTGIFITSCLFYSCLTRITQSQQNTDRLD